MLVTCSPAILVSERAREDLLYEDAFHCTAIFISYFPTHYHHTQTAITIWENERGGERGEGEEGGRERRRGEGEGGR